MGRWRLGMGFVLAVLITLTPVTWAQTSSPTPTVAEETAPVVLDGRELFRVPPANVWSAQERANIIASRLTQVAQAENGPIVVTQHDKRHLTVLRVGDRSVLSISEDDAQILGESRQELVKQYSARITKALEDYRRSRSPQKILRGILYTVLATIAWVVFYRLIRFLFGKSARYLEAKDEQEFPRLHLFNLDLVPPARVKGFIVKILRRTHLIVALIGFYFYLAFVFGQFVWTARLGKQLVGYTLETLASVWKAFVDYLPNLINIAVTIVIVYYLLLFLRFIARRLETGELQIPGFYQDWVKPTYRLLTTFILALALMIVVPFLPGFRSPAFQGVSIFIGLVISLGSTETVTNAVAGIILIYSRAFQVGDVVKIRDVQGRIEEKTLLVTRIRTPRNELVTLPNSMVLNSPITNFSATRQISLQQPLLLHTTVTLGYDTPWPKIYRALTEAALRTPGILAEPAPFVWQTALNDFHVSYTIHAATDQPERMPAIYSDLHQNIQDCCNEAGIEIMSPAYTAIRDGHHTTIPASYLPKDYQAPGIRIHPLSRLWSRSSDPE